jgi:hypothetical protein
MRKTAIIFTISLITFCAAAQGKKKAGAFNGAKNKVSANQFLQQQWWLGIKGGISLAQADAAKRYSILTPTNYDASLLDKKYDAFTELGIQTTLEVTYYYKGFYFSFQPSYLSSNFTYSNQLEWVNPQNLTETLLQTYKQTQKVEYADLPFLIKYDITGATLRPYVQVGVFYSILINAVKTVEVSSVDQASGGTNVIVTEPLIVGAKDLFSNYWGLVGGIGVAYQLGNVRLTLEANYRQSMSNIVNPQNRFSNDRLSGIGDAQDDLNLKNVSISAGVLFPMRYLSNSFKSNDR